jgi:hypothetical protein
MLEELITRVISPKEHTGNDHQTDDGQLQVIEQHGAIRLDNGHEECCRKGISQHQLIQNLRVFGLEDSPLPCHVSQEHDDENGKDVFN